MGLLPGVTDTIDGVNSFRHSLLHKAKPLGIVCFLDSPVTGVAGSKLRLETNDGLNYWLLFAHKTVVDNQLLPGAMLLLHADCLPM